MKYFQQINAVLKSSAFRSAGIYLFSNFFAKATSFLLLFIYSNPKYISVDENGLLNLLSNGVYIFMPFISLGLIQSTSVDFFKLKKNEFKDFFTTSFVLPVIITVCSILLMLLFRDQLKSLYSFPIAFCYLIPLMAFLSFCSEQYTGLIRNNKKPITFLRVSMIRLFIEVSLSVVLVVMFAWRWHGRVTGIMVANVFMLLVALFYFKKNGYLFGNVKTEYLKSELAFALPVILMQCSTFCLYASDKFFLSYFTNNTEVGIYGYACVFSSVVIIASSALISYVRPLLYENLSSTKPDARSLKKVFYFYLGGNFLALVAVVLVTPLLYKYFINHNYYPGLKYMFLIAIGYFFSTITSFVYAFMLFHKQRRKIMYISMFAVVVSLLSNYLLIGSFNAFGAAISVCVSYLTVLIFAISISRKNYAFMFAKHVEKNNTYGQQD